MVWALINEHISNNVSKEWLYKQTLFFIANSYIINQQIIDLD